MLPLQDPLRIHGATHFLFPTHHGVPPWAKPELQGSPSTGTHSNCVNVCIGTTIRSALCGSQGTMNRPTAPSCLDRLNKATSLLCVATSDGGGRDPFYWCTPLWFLVQRDGGSNGPDSINWLVASIPLTDHIYTIRVCSFVPGMVPQWNNRSKYQLLDWLISHHLP
jgi:hypothetical protein